LLDARILADVYLAMTGGQATLSLDGESDGARSSDPGLKRVDRTGLTLIVRRADADEHREHKKIMSRIREQVGGPTLWDQLEQGNNAD
jgi:DNA polymerase-3 subunit epsilon